MKTSGSIEWCPRCQELVLTARETTSMSRKQEVIAILCTRCIMQIRRFVQDKERRRRVTRAPGGVVGCPGAQVEEE